MADKGYTSIEKMKCIFQSLIHVYSVCPSIAHETIDMRNFIVILIMQLSFKKKAIIMSRFAYIDFIS